MRKIIFFLSLLMICSTAEVFAAYSDSEYYGAMTDKEKKISAIRTEEIKAVRTALGLRSPENRKAELYLRLAELYMESYRQNFLLEGRIHENVVQRNPNARMDRARSISDLKNGIDSAEQITHMKVDPAKMDKVHYFLAYNYGELGEQKKSLEHYEILNKQYPNSIYTIEAQKALGDVAFSKGNFTEAESYYESALRRAREPSQQARLYHKLAWCYYRTKRSNQAIDSMKRAIAIAQTDQEKYLNIREEGLRDIAIFYAETGRVEEAIQYFRENSGGDEKLVKTLEKLGREYERGGQTDKAKVVYDALLKIPVKDESSFRATVKLIELDMLRQRYDSAADRLETLKIPAKPDVDTNVSLQNLRNAVRKTAVDHHARYRKADDKDDAKKLLHVADRFYWLFLKLFLSDKNTPRADQNEIKMYWAEVKRDLGQPGDAATLYRQIVMDKDPKYSKEAAQFWVSSLVGELKLRKERGEKPGEIPSEIEKEFVDAADVLEKSIPDSVESREARLRAAQILAAYPGERGNAIQRASRLANEAPTTPQGVLAARLWLQLQSDKETAQQVKSIPGLMEADAKQKGELAKDLEAAQTKMRVGEIAAFEKNKNFSEAAKGYEEFAAKAKTEKEADKAYIGAVSAYAQSGSSEDVARVMKDWRKRYPKSKLVLKTTKEQATQLFIRGMFPNAAEIFLGIGREFRDSSSYLTAAALFDGALQRQKSRDAYKIAYSIAANDEERAKINKSIAEISNDLKDELGAFNEWKDCFAKNTSLKAECGTQVGNYYLRLSDVRQGKIAFENVVNIKKGPSSKSPYIAYAQFRLSQILEREMKNPPLEFPEERLLKAFTQRVEELKPVSNAYQKAISLGGPWGIAATERLGDLALGLSQEVSVALKSPSATPNLKQALEPVAAALKSKAIENSKNAYKEALKRQILSPALPVVHDRLVDAGVDQMNRAQGARVGIRLIGISADGGQLGKEKAMEQTREKLLQKVDDALLWIDYGNLLWGIGKPGLSKVAYQRALDLKTRMADALNNVAVVMVSDQGLENWFASNEATAVWKRALGYESNNSAALYNLGHYFNYFRLFSLSVPYFEQINRKLQIGEVHDGLGIADYALGRVAESNLEFSRAEELGQDKNRFAKKYIEASKANVEGRNRDCLGELKDIDQELKGFEKVAFDRLKARCQ